MQVFKTFMKIGKKKLPVVILYIVIFLGINIAMSTNSSVNDTFKETKLDICVVDMDNSEASKSLTDYIKSRHNIIDIKTDKDTILDSLYYQTVDYVLTIKDGYSQNLSNGKTDNLFTNYQVSNSYNSQLFDTQLNQYVGSVSAYISGGFDMDYALKETTAQLNNQVNVTTANFSNTAVSDYPTAVYYYFQYMPYIFLSILIAGLCPILLVMTRKDIKNRTNCSAISSSKQTLQLIFGSTIFVLGMWLLFIIVAFILYGNAVFHTKGLLAILNSFVFLLVSTSITLLISVFSPNSNVVSMIANTLGLGMSFLCGIFVPQSLLGSSVLSVAKFLPAYWFVKANNMLAGVSEEAYNITTYLSYIGIEMAFVVALFALVLLITKTKKVSKSN